MYLDKDRTQFFDLPGVVESRFMKEWPNICFPRGREDVRLFVAVDLNTCILHRDGCFRNTVQAQTAGDLCLDMIGFRGTGQGKGKPLWVRITQESLCRFGQPISA